MVVIIVVCIAGKSISMLSVATPCHNESSIHSNFRRVT
jgi:hypothetical protein